MASPAHPEAHRAQRWDSGTLSDSLGQSGKNTAHRSWGSCAGRPLRTLPGWPQPCLEKGLSLKLRADMLPRAREEIIGVEGSYLSVVPAADITGQEGQPPVQNTLTLGSETIPAKQTRGPVLPSRTSVACAVLVGGRAVENLTGWAVGSLTGWVSTDPATSGQTLPSPRLSILVLLKVDHHEPCQRGAGGEPGSGTEWMCMDGSCHYDDTGPR